ncbi:F-box domain [Dillenia turbinata]|uniref:F-box domain n=1 Tax=Dillenia turbinata TaxID=194707 RepID=A0AAN8VBT9_9MAGN
MHSSSSRGFVLNVLQLYSISFDRSACRIKIDSDRVSCQFHISSVGKNSFMAFECQKITVLKNSVDNLSKEHSEQDWVEFGSDTEIRTKKSLVSKPPHGFIRPKKGITTLSTSGTKSVPSDDVSSNVCITDLPSALISEILNCLDPKELGIVSCVSTSLYKLASEHRVWKDYYCERWGLPLVPILESGVSEEKSWRELFVEREFRSKTFMGRYSIDALHGHTEAVRTVFLLASAKLLFTSGYDCIVRMWDMEEGLSIESSKPLGCTIRAVAADTRLLVAGGTDGFIHCWKAMEGVRHLFDLKGNHNQEDEFRLWEHLGPITCLALDITRIYSGSWDMTVCIWDRSSLKCMKVLSHRDWVWDLAPHNLTVVTSAGSDVYVWDVDGGTPDAIIHGAHIGLANALARSHTGDFFFSGGEDGAIHMFEITSHGSESNVSKIATWIPHTGPVCSLGFEFPWLVSASSDGKLALINVRKLMRTSRCSSLKKNLEACSIDRNAVEPPQRMLHGFGCNLFSVDIGADRIVCGGEEGVVRIWNFSRALEIEQRARALRGIRLENRIRRRKLQVELNCKGSRSDQCSVAAKKNPMNSERNGAWHNKRGVNGKVKA